MTIAILYDDSTGRITNRYYDTKDDSTWTNTEDSAWPEDQSGEWEIPEYYYDEGTGDITIQYRTIPEEER
jgi:hypothetical protein